MGDLTALLEMVKAAEGPSRELDLAVLNGVSERPWRWVAKERDTITCNKYGEGAAGNSICSFEYFTSSIDAALELVERVLPGAEYKITNLYGVAGVELPINGTPSYGRREDGDIPLAILAALISAKIEEDSHG